MLQCGVIPTHPQNLSKLGVFCVCMCVCVSVCPCVELFLGDSLLVGKGKPRKTKGSRKQTNSSPLKQTRAPWSLSRALGGEPCRSPRGGRLVLGSRCKGKLGVNFDGSWTLWMSWWGFRSTFEVPHKLRKFFMGGVAPCG